MTTEGSRGLNEAKAICRDRTVRVREWKDRGRKVMGYMCLHPPLELVTAFGMAPYRLFGDHREAVTEGERLFMPSVCPFLRSVIDLGMKGRYAFLDGVIGAHICDIGAMMMHLWRDYVKNPSFVHFIDVPHTANPSAIDFFRQQLELLIGDLEALTGEPLYPDRLAEAIVLHNRQRSLVRALYELRVPDPPRLSGVEAQEVLLALTGLPVEEGNALLEAVIEEAAQGQAVSSGMGKPRILLWGSVIDDTGLFDVVASAGGEVVVDDICTGTRAYWTDVAEGGDPLAALAERCLAGIRCPRTYRQKADGQLLKAYLPDLEARFGYLQPLLRHWRVDGVILQGMLYCDTHGYEIPALKDYLAHLEVPCLVIENDYRQGARQQVQTRVEAFLEILGQ